MVTLEQLKKQNFKLKQQAKLGEERKALTLENRRLTHPRVFAVADKLVGVTQQTLKGFKMQSKGKSKGNPFADASDRWFGRK